MRGVFTLVGQSLRRRRVFLAAACLMLIGFQLLTTLTASSLQKSGRLLQLEGIIPDFIVQWTNMAFLSFRGLVLIGYSHPVVLLFLVALTISIGTEPAAEIESKFVDLIMARPLPRRAVVLRSAVLLVLSATGAVVNLVAGGWLGLKLFAPPLVAAPDARTVWLALNLGCVALAWGAIALAIASVAKRRATAAGVCALLAFSMFVLDYMGRFWDTLKGISRISPFHYFTPFELIGGRAFPSGDIAVLLGITALATLFAGITYRRRDL